VLAVALLLCGCWDFDKALAACQQPDGACILDAGSVGDAGGPGDAGTQDAGGPWQLVYGGTSRLPASTLCAVSPREVWYATYDPDDPNAGNSLVQYLDGGVTQLSPSSVVHSITADGGTILFGGRDNNGFVSWRPAGQKWGGTALPETAFDSEILAAWFAGTQTWVADRFNSTIYLNAQTSPVGLDGGLANVFAGAGITDGDFWCLAAQTDINDDHTNATVLHYQGGGWVTTYDSSMTLNGISAAGPDDVYVAGLASTLLRFHANGTFDPISLPGAIDVSAVWAAAPGDVFVVGEDSAHEGIAMHLGSGGPQTWTVAPYRLTSVSGTSATDVWAGDSDGGLWHYTP
jgi:hypothetical protein